MRIGNNKRIKLFPYLRFMFSTPKNTAIPTYTFGSIKASVSKGEYRYGFNGKETDNETGLQDYGFRIYNPSYGKFLSVDPLFRTYPWYTPYQFAGNKPVISVDLDGLEEFVIIRWYENSKFMGTTVTYLLNEGQVRLHNDKKVMIINQVYSTENQELIRGGDIYKINNSGKITDLNDKAKGLIYSGNNQKFTNNFKNKSESILGIAIYKFQKENPNLLKSPSALLKEEPRKINFGFNDSDPLKIDDGIIKKYKEFLNTNPDYIIEITGFTDAKGSDDYNYRLGLKRANEAKEYFISQGINPESIVIDSKGKSEAQVSENSSNEEREKDRRIEIRWKPAENN
jgi:RHS repeat-associated protein